MGLLDSLLEVPEHLRVWQMAGVRHFYLDPQAASVPEPEVAAGEAVSGASDPGQPPGALPAAATPTPSAAVEPSPAPPAAVPTSALPPHPADWPAPWPSLYAKAPPRPRLVIAYRELGLDLTGQADPRRGGLWRTLIHDLGLAGQNAVAFWPLALPQNGELVDQPEAFAAGLALFSPAITAVFGPLPPAVAAALAAREDTAGLPVVTLPHPEELLQGDTEAWDHVRTLLAVG
ncbi:MAG: hypothetical protein ACLGQH_09265 [Acidobacteriota bacterium]